MYVIDYVIGDECDEIYDKLVLSVGVVLFDLLVFGYDLVNIYVMCGCDWVIKLKVKIVDFSVKNVVVIGFGYIGIEVVEVFVKVGMYVMVIDLLLCLFSFYFD